MIPNPPAWLGTTAGVTEAVLPPYTPVEVKYNAIEAVLDVWGREYRLGGLSLPRQIISRDAPDSHHRATDDARSRSADRVRLYPAGDNADKYPNTKPQMVSSVRLRSVWQDALVDHMSRMMYEFDIDGVYLDNMNMPFPCMNA